MSAWIVNICSNYTLSSYLFAVPSLNKDVTYLFHKGNTKMYALLLCWCKIYASFLMVFFFGPCTGRLIVWGHCLQTHPTWRLGAYILCRECVQYTLLSSMWAPKAGSRMSELYLPDLLLLGRVTMLSTHTHTFTEYRGYTGPKSANTHIHRIQRLHRSKVC